MKICIYFLRSKINSEKLYIGVSENVYQRLREHNNGKCTHTSKFRPWKVVYVEEFCSKREAMARERQLKRWSRGKKEALIAGDRSKLKRLSKCKNP